MSLRSFAFGVKQHLQSTMGVPISHSHVYELLASAFGFHSSAALNSDHLLAVATNSSGRSISPALLQRRLAELGYGETATRAAEILAAYIKEGDLACYSLRNVVSILQEDPFELLDVETDAELQVLIDGLERLAGKGNPAAHFALALLYGGERTDDDHQPGMGGEYWLERMQAGEALDGVPLEWAITAQELQQKRSLRLFHLMRAAALGHHGAVLELAELGEDPRWLEQAWNLDSVDDPLRLAELAYGHGREEDARRWYYVAAAQGDPEAMRTLVEELEPNNHFQGWVWIYLSAELDNDIRRGTMRAYHDGGAYDGELYDDDIGGPLYVDGDEGVHIPALDAASDTRAKLLAKELYAKLNDSLPETK